MTIFDTLIFFILREASSFIFLFIDCKYLGPRYINLAYKYFDFISLWNNFQDSVFVISFEIYASGRSFTKAY